MTTLAEFLLARIAEDDAAVDGAYQGEEIGYPLPDIARVFVRKVDRDVVSKRRVVDLHTGPDYWESPNYHLCVDSMTQNDACETLRALALPYADHPDYQLEWKPSY